MKNLLNTRFNVPIPVMVGSAALCGIALSAPMTGSFGAIKLAELAALALYLGISFVAIRAAGNAMFARTVPLLLEKAGMAKNVASAFTEAKAVRFMLFSYGAALLMGGSGPSWMGRRIAYAEASQAMGLQVSQIPYLVSPFLNVSVRLGLLLPLVGLIVMCEGWRSMRTARSMQRGSGPPPE